MDGEKVGEKNGNDMSQNVDVVTSILEEVKTPEVSEDERGDALVKELFGEIGEVVEKKANEAEQKGYMSRREFVKKSAELIGATAIMALFSACGVKPDSLNSQGKKETPLPESMPTEVPLEGTEREYDERGYILVEKPFKLDTTKFIMGESGYRSAIAERFPFPAIDESGKNYTLKYGREGEEVTFLHFTGGKPPVTGEILPLIYKLPSKVKSLEVYPYAISNPANTPKEIQITDTDECYLIPIVTSGSDTGIFPNTDGGNLVNSSYPIFKVIPDNISKNENGYLSWALLNRQGEDIVMEGVVSNSMSKEKLFIDYKNVPVEISNLYE